ncbi:jg6653, partial [Pararge aegeria aegeria]
TISAMGGKLTRSSISRQLRRSVHEQSARSWLSASDLECVLCTNTYRSPVSTPCGHTYCRECIERSLFYNKKCALCLSSLENFNVAEISCESVPEVQPQGEVLKQSGVLAGTSPT